MEKPRIKYGTVAWLLNRYVNEFPNIGQSQRCQLDVIARSSSLGLKLASELSLADYRSYAVDRRANRIPTRLFRVNPLKEISPATVGKDFASISVVLTHAKDYWDVDVNLELLKTAKRKLKKEGLIAKSQPRERRPSDEEFHRLEEYFDAQNNHENCETDMVLMARWQRYSGRRVGESCALLWEDWRPESHTILVRKMKDPHRKNKAKVVALPEAAQIMLEQLWMERGCPAEGRIFPFKAHTVSSRYTIAKKDLGIQGLRLHDSRRDCATRLVEDERLTPAEAILVTGHETTAIFERVYMKLRPENLAKRLEQLQR